MIRSAYPRINCVVPDCRRGSTRYKPGTELLCGQHWRKVPLSWRRKMALYRRARTLAERKGNQDKVRRPRAASGAGGMRQCGC